MTSYQKLKKKNEELTKQLIVLSTEPNSIEASHIRMTWKMKSDFEKAMMFGNSGTHIESYRSGLGNFITRTTIAEPVKITHA